MNLGAYIACRRTAGLLLLAVLLGGLVPSAQAQAATQIDIPGPARSGEFGRGVIALPNGNFVVLDPFWDSSTQADVGAAYLYNGATAALISTLTGSHLNDKVGWGSVTVLANGHFVVQSPAWDGGRGAVTWCSATTGCSGTVGAGNSLVGTTAGDSVGGTVVPLTGGAYVVESEYWDKPGAVTNAGAATWCSGTGPCIGAVSESNSLVGDQAEDRVGTVVVPLSNGHYVVRSPDWHSGRGAATWCNGTIGRTGRIYSSNSLVGGTAEDQVGWNITRLPTGAYVVESPFWDNAGTVNAGAVTRCSGTGTCFGTVSSSNSLVGTHANDQVGSHGTTALPTGDHVVQSPHWNGNQGAATRCSGTSGCKGSVSAGNSLVGSHAGDYVGYDVTVLANGHYVVHSPDWFAGRGAATWCNGATGRVETVSSTNSLVGSAAGDRVGAAVAALTNGHYVVGSHSWNGGRGAATWCNGTTGRTGSSISASNSLVGGAPGDAVGLFITALPNGHYVVQSPDWAGNRGAVTWGSGTAGVKGEVTSGNSLVGTTAGDEVGVNVRVLANGHYVASAPDWDNGSDVDAGAATWCDGTAGCTGAVSAANSLIGGQDNDRVGYSVTALTNGHYVVVSPGWTWSTAVHAGAVTWCDGTTGCTGTPSTDNSLHGGRSNDWTGYLGASALPNGHYVVISPDYDRGITVDAGAITPGWGWSADPHGPISANNSVRGTAAGGGDNLRWDYDPVYNQFIVGRPADNTVTLFRWAAVYLPLATREL